MDLCCSLKLNSCSLVVYSNARKTDHCRERCRVIGSRASASERRRASMFVRAWECVLCGVEVGRIDRTVYRVRARALHYTPHSVSLRQQVLHKNCHVRYTTTTACQCLVLCRPSECSSHRSPPSDVTTVMWSTMCSGHVSVCDRVMCDSSCSYYSRCCLPSLLISY